MKALIIADNEKVIKKIDSTIRNLGYDVIVYKWLLKALDNIEEINPHIIIISTVDYPRHWKTLVQFTETASANDFSFPKVILYTNDKFSDDEQKKASALHIIGTFKEELLDLDDKYIGLESLISNIGIVPQKLSEENVSVEVEEKSEDFNNTETSSDESQRKQMICSFVFTNPVTLSLVTGIARNFNGSTLSFTPDVTSFVENLTEGTVIKCATLKIFDSEETINPIKKVAASVISNDSESLVLKIS